MSKIISFLFYAMIAILQSYAFSAKSQISLNSLLNEMVSYDAIAVFPTPYYRAAQVSSYDRRTVSPFLPGWFANNDGGGYVRLDTIGGRVEKVLFEENGPGVVTRIWLTTNDKRGVLRIYFDGNPYPEIEIPAYDTSAFPIDVGKALSLKHTHYDKDISKTGGTTLFLPLPYSKSCRITFEEPDYSVKLPRYYQVCYRQYKMDTSVRTFSLRELQSLHNKIAVTNNLLLAPKTFNHGIKSRFIVNSANDKPLTLPKGNRAIKSLLVSISGFSPEKYSELMDSIWIKIDFDGTECVCCSLSDFFSGGKGAPSMNSWYFSSDGKGSMLSRWVMPYKKTANIRLESHGTLNCKAAFTVYTDTFDRTENAMYFHARTHLEKNIPVNNDYDSNTNLDWNFTTINGRGVYCGDLLSLYNHCPDWYGEGDEKIWVDHDKFPSFMGTGLEDYYNCSWAPVVAFMTPFGGAPRADESSSHGQNAFLRTRNLDVIPFNNKFKFDMEMLSWHKGVVDYNVTAFWYGSIGH